MYPFQFSCVVFMEKITYRAQTLKFKAFTKALKITVWEICEYKDGGFHQLTENNSMRNMWVQRWKLSPRHWKWQYEKYAVPWWKLPSLYWHISHTVIFSALVKASIFVLKYFSCCYFQCLGESLHLCTHIFLILLFSVPWRLSPRHWK
jgi:hypothetical protein